MSSIDYITTFNLPKSIKEFIFKKPEDTDAEAFLYKVTVDDVKKYYGGFHTGYVGDGYQGDGTQTYGMNPGITDLYNNPTGIQFGNTGPNVGYMGGNMGGYYTGTTPMQDITRGIMNNIYNRGYGVMDFPVFSGITSLVPSDARATIRR